MIEHILCSIRLGTKFNFSRCSGNYGENARTGSPKRKEGMDRYSRFVLTIIAISLIWICARDLAIVSEAIASSGVVEVKVVGMDFNRYRPVPVEVRGEITCRQK